MSFLAPVAFALAALIPVIVAMYLLKLRRTEQIVSSVYLWRRMVRDVEANAPWQRLRRNLLLILQLLFLAALILALARPFTWTEGASSQALILILDTSASMAAGDATPNRLEVAKAEARQLVDGLPDDARVTVITAGDGAQVLVASSQDRRLVQQAIDGIYVGTGGGDLTAALELASAIAARQPDTEIAILSDGRATLPERLAVKGRVRYLPLGQSGDNQAISTLSLEPALGGENMTAFVQVTNYGDAPAQRRLLLYADDQMVDAYDLEITPGGQRAVVAGDLPMNTHVLEAQLTGQDALSLDDAAWAVHRNAEPASVTLVTDGNLFLETALAILPGLEVTTVRPEDWKGGRLEDWKSGRLVDVPESPDLPASHPPNLPITQSSNLPLFQSSNLPTSQPSNLTIFDAYVPITATLPAGNLLFIAPSHSTAYFTVTGTLDQPLPRPVDAADPLLAYVDLAEVNVLEAVRMPLPPWARAVVMGDVPGDSAPLLFAGNVDGRRVAALAFDLHRSDLPLQVAFPLLLANLTGWLAPGSGSDLPAQVSPASAVTLSLPPEAESATVTRPDGTTARLLPESGRVVFADTTQLGVYRVTWRGAGQDEEGGTAQASFAVNLLGEEEAALRPQQARREWWRPLALVALLLLTAEWLVYQRAALARLWRETRQVMISKTSNVKRQG
ncbi:MAG: VWA domain-containing protein [Anaerolineae bacterium]